jgi:hypothetical protein
VQTTQKQIVLLDITGILESVQFVLQTRFAQIQLVSSNVLIGPHLPTARLPTVSANAKMICSKV